MIMNIFHIYFHRDFDGICSAAIFAEIINTFQLTNTVETSFHGVDYEIKDDWLNIKLNKPNAVLDFLYHPDALWWFDHHVSAFLVYELKEKYKNGTKQFWDPSYPSCPSLIKEHFSKYLPLFASNFFHFYSQWIKWSDKIDSAKYSSPYEIIELSHPCLQINSTLAIDNSDQYLIYLIQQIRHKSPEEVATLDRVQEKYSIIKSKQNQIVKDFKELIKIEDHRIAYFDQSDLKIPFQRYISYYFYPTVDYTVAIYKKNGNTHSVSVGKNPWKDFQSRNIGKICKRYGGGGRPDVGAINTKDHLDAVNIAKKIKKILLS